MGSLRLPPDQLFYDGRWRLAAGDGVLSVVNPATEEVLGTVAAGDASDASAAIAAARCAFDDGPWSRMSGLERAASLRRFRDALASRIDDISALVIAEVGTTVAATRSHQVGLPIEHLSYWAEMAERSDTDEALERGDGRWTVLREPVGVVAAITAYNFPFLLNVMKLGPALAAGNTVVLKPSPYTPYSALVLAEAAASAELPPGVLNVIPGGVDVGSTLTTDPRVDLVSFTGSDAVGATIMAQAAPTLKRVLLELGGKSPLIVRHDADLYLAAKVGLSNFTFHAGQGCALCTRHLVHRSLHDKYVEKVASLGSQLVIGDPAEPATQMGPLIRPQAVDRTDGYVVDAVAQGAQVVIGGHRPPGLTKGYFYEPTLLTDVKNDWRVAREEIFGPVAVVMPFDDDDEAVRLANASDYGLDGHVISADTAAAFQLASRLRTGGVSINGGAGYTNPAVPFGGYKRSGIGRENGQQGFDEYVEFKTIKCHAG